MNLKTCTHALRPQVHRLAHENHRLVPEAFPAPENSARSGKPAAGTGLWSSTHSKGTSEWIEWCIGEDFQVPHDGVWHVAILDPCRTAKVLCIDNLEDLKRIIACYLISGDKWRLHLDWERMARDGYHGVHLSSEGESATRFSTPDLYGWDCESTVWLAWAFEHIEYTTIKTKPEKEKRHELPRTISR